MTNKNTEEKFIDVKLRKYSSDDLPQIIDILVDSFPDWKEKKEPYNYWKWKYLKPPYGSYVYVLSLNERVLGVAHLILIKIKLGSKIVTGQYSDDDAIHPEYRGKGLYNKFVGVRRTTPASVSYWITNNPINIERARKMGIMQLPFINTRMLRIKNIKSYLEENKLDSIETRLGLSFLKKINDVKNKFNQEPIGSEVSIVNVKEFDEGIKVFLEKLNENYQLIIFRDREFLNWRFCDKNSGNIIVCQAIDNNQIIGYLALEIKKKEDYLEGYVLDLLALPDRLDVAKLLFNEICAISDKMNVNVVHYRVIKDHPYEKLAEKYGFLDVTRWSNFKIYINEYESAQEQGIDIRSIRSYSPNQVHLPYSDFF
jgi:hypothetical protein